jgi:hypothetical protein
MAFTPDNNDVDFGTTTLISPAYDISETRYPVVAYKRWFTNDLSPLPFDRRDTYKLEVSDNGGLDWSLLEEIGRGTPLDWVDVRLPLFPTIDKPPGEVMFRVTARDLGEQFEETGIVEAGIDRFQIVDRNRGCAICSGDAPPVTSIAVSRAGDDILLDWNDDPAMGSRFAVYKLDGDGLGQALLVGTTDARQFVHSGAAGGLESYFYRVATIDACGGEGPLD